MPVSGTKGPAPGSAGDVPSRTWRQRLHAIPWNFVAVLAIVPAFVLLQEVWGGWRWNVRLHALRRIQAAAAGQRSGLSPVGLTERARPWRKLVEHYVPIPQAASRLDDPFGFIFSEVDCSALYLYEDFTDASLADVGAFPEVRELRVSDAKVTDAGLAPLRNLRELRSLSLQKLAIRGSGLAYLEPLRFLEKLNLEGTQLDDTGLRSLPGLPSLGELSLAGVPIAGEGLACLSRLPQLSSLVLRGSAVGDRGLQSLPHVPTLRSLDLSDVEVRGDGLVALRQLPRLKTVLLDQTPIDDA